MIRGPKYLPDALPAPIMIPVPAVLIPFGTNFLMIIITAPIAIPIANPVNNANGKLMIGSSIPDANIIAGIPTPTPVKREPPISRMPTSGPSNILAKRKPAANPAAEA